MSAPTSLIKKALRLLLAEPEGQPVDLLPLHVAAGLPRGKSPIIWAARTGIDPGISVEGEGRGRKAWGGRAVVRESDQFATADGSRVDPDSEPWPDPSPDLAGDPLPDWAVARDPANSPGAGSITSSNRPDRSATS